MAAPFVGRLCSQGTLACGPCPGPCGYRAHEMDGTDGFRHLGVAVVAKLTKNLPSKCCAKAPGVGLPN
eukprot:250265-Amphidinium_carterae.1